MEVLLKIVLFFFVLSLLARLFFRYVLPWWLKRFVRKQQDKFNQQYNNPRPEGETYVRTEPEKGRVNPDVGEYIDFEELDDNNETENHE